MLEPTTNSLNVYLTWNAISLLDDTALPKELDKQTIKGLIKTISGEVTLKTACRAYRLVPPNLKKSAVKLSKALTDAGVWPDSAWRKTGFDPPGAEAANQMATGWYEDEAATLALHENLHRAILDKNRLAALEFLVHLPSLNSNYKTDEGGLTYTVLKHFPDAVLFEEILKKDPTPYAKNLLKKRCWPPSLEERLAVLDFFSKLESELALKIRDALLVYGRQSQGIRLLSKIPQKYWEMFCEALINKKYYRLEAIIATLEVLPEKELTDFDLYTYGLYELIAPCSFEEAEELIPAFRMVGKYPYMHGVWKEKALIAKLRSLPPGERVKICERAKTIFDDVNRSIYPDISLEGILDILQTIPYEKCQAFFQATKSLRDKKALYSEAKSMGEACGIKKNIFFDAVTILSNQKTSWAEIQKAMPFILSLPSGDEMAFCKVLSPFLGISDTNQILDALAKINDASRLDICQRVISLIKADDPEWDGKWEVDQPASFWAKALSPFAKTVLFLIETLKPLSSDERKNLHELAEICLQDELTGYGLSSVLFLENVEQVVRKLLQLPIEYREVVKKVAGDDREKTKYLLTLPDSWGNQEDVIAMVMELALRGHDVAFITTVVELIGREEIEDGKDLAGAIALLGKEYKINEHLLRILEVPVGQREAICKKALALAPGSKKILTIILTLGQLAEETDASSKDTLPDYIKAGLTDSTWEQIANMIIRLPKGRKRSVSEQTIKLTKAENSEWQKRHLITLALGKLEKLQEIDAAYHAIKRLAKEDCNQMMALFTEIARFPQDYQERICKELISWEKNGYNLALIKTVIGFLKELINKKDREWYQDLQKWKRGNVALFPIIDMIQAAPEPERSGVWDWLLKKAVFSKWKELVKIAPLVKGVPLKDIPDVYEHASYISSYHEKWEIERIVSAIKRLPADARSAARDIYTLEDLEEVAKIVALWCQKKPQRSGKDLMAKFSWIPKLIRSEASQKLLELIPKEQRDMAEEGLCLLENIEKSEEITPVVIETLTELLNRDLDRKSIASFLKGDVYEELESYLEKLKTLMKKEVDNETLQLLGSIPRYKIFDAVLLVDELIAFEISESFIKKMLKQILGEQSVSYFMEVLTEAKCKTIPKEETLQLLETMVFLSEQDFTMKNFYRGLKKNAEIYPLIQDLQLSEIEEIGECLSLLVPAENWPEEPSEWELKDIVAQVKAVPAGKRKQVCLGVQMLTFNEKPSWDVRKAFDAVLSQNSLFDGKKELCDALFNLRRKGMKWSQFHTSIPLFSELPKGPEGEAFYVALLELHKRSWSDNPIVTEAVIKAVYDLSPNDRLQVCQIVYRVLRWDAPSDLITYLIKTFSSLSSEEQLQLKKFAKPYHTGYIRKAIEIVMTLPPGIRYLYGEAIRDHTRLDEWEDIKYLYTLPDVSVENRPNVRELVLQLIDKEYRTKSIIEIVKASTVKVKGPKYVRQD